MKRLKVTIFIFFICVTLSLVAFANEVNKKRRSFFDSSFLGDSTLQSAIEHFENRMNEFSSFSSLGQNSMFKTEWQEDSKGRTFYINPTNDGLNLDIKIENGMIQIKSSQEKNSEGMHSQSVSTQMMSIPQDCNADAAQISQLDDGVKIFFPYKKEVEIKEIKRERIPIKPNDDSVDI